MPYTTHWNLPLLPTGAVDWVALINDLVGKLEAGRTLKLTAYEALAKGKAFVVDVDGKARLASSATRVDGVWQSSSTSAGAQGYGQVGGLMSEAGWAWTPGNPIYAAAAGALTQVAGDDGPIGVALTATQILIAPRGVSSGSGSSGVGIDLVGYFETEVTTAASGGAAALDYTAGNIRIVTIEDGVDTAITFTGLPAAGKAPSATLLLIMAGAVPSSITVAGVPVDLTGVTATGKVVVEATRINNIWFIGSRHAS